VQLVGAQHSDEKTRKNMASSGDHVAAMAISIDKEAVKNLKV